MEKQLTELQNTLIDDYNRVCKNKDMQNRFADTLRFKKGKKYIKVTVNGSAWGFIVATDNDSHFRKGDILKAANWSSPARNFPRGNILDGNYHVQWMGA